MAIAKVFRSGNSQAVRLPKQFRLTSDEVEPAIKDISSALLHPHGPRSELEACVTKFEAALNKMRSTRQALKSQVTRLADQGEHFPTS